MSTGIGRSIVEKLAQFEGVQIVALSRTRFNLESLKQEFPQVQTVEVDVLKWAKTREAVSSLGPVDVLINNAGVAILQPFLEVDEETYNA